MFKVENFLQMDQPERSSQELNRSDLFLIAALFITALAIRLYFIRFYDVISTDGTAYVGVARGIRLGDFRGVSGYGFYPVMVWLAGIVVPDLEGAGRLVSAFFGAVLVVPFYMLGAELFSRRVVTAASIVMIIWPSLRHWSCEVMTQSLYIALAYAGTYMVWRMVKNRSIYCAIAAGALLSLAYFTRTEGILLFFVLPIPLLMATYKEIRLMVKPLLAYILSFSLLTFANILFIKTMTGDWQLATKTSVALTDAISYIMGIPDMNYIPGVKPTSYLEIITEYPLFIWANSLRNIGQFFLTLMPFYFWIFFVVGFAVNKLNPKRNLTRLFLLSVCSPLTVIIVFYYIGPEYTQAYMPVILLFCAEGAATIEAAIRRRLPESLSSLWISDKSPILYGLAILFLCSTIISQLPKQSANTPYTPDQDGGRRDMKTLGLLLKEKLPPGKLMTRWPRIGFYSEHEWLNIPKVTIPELHEEAVKMGIRFLVIDGGLMDLRPELQPLMEPLAVNVKKETFFHPVKVKPIYGFKPFFMFLSPTSNGVAVYEVVPLEGK